MDAREYRHTGRDVKGKTDHDRRSCSSAAFLLRRTLFASPAIANVRTSGFFAYGVELQPSEVFLDLAE